MRPTRDDLLVLATATRRPRQLARLAAAALVDGHDVDVQVVRLGQDYNLILRVVGGEQLVAEHTLPIVWDDLYETTRLAILGMYVAQMIASVERTRRRAPVALASIPPPP